MRFRHPVTAAFAAIVALVAGAPAWCIDDVAGPGRNAEEAAEAADDLFDPPSQAPAPDVMPAVVPPLVVPQSLIVRPQVNMAGFTRDYRPVHIDATETDAAIRAALDRRIAEPWDFREATLRQVVERLRVILGVPVVLDVMALGDNGVDPDETTVTARLSGMSVRQALKILLGQFGDGDVGWIAADEAVTVTTVEKTHEQLVRVAYPLPRWAGPTDADGMLELVSSTVAPQTWEFIGGPGIIKFIEVAGEPMLVVSQTCAIHQEVERLLRALHERGLAEFAAGGPVLKVHHVADDRARADLERRLKDLCNARLGAEADPAAEVESVGDSLVVRSKSPLFHALAAQVAAAVAGVDRGPGPVMVEVGVPGPMPGQ